MNKNANTLVRPGFVFLLVTQYPYMYEYTNNTLWFASIIGVSLREEMYQHMHGRPQTFFQGGKNIKFS